MSAAMRAKKPRDKRLFFIGLDWVGGCLGLGGEDAFVPRESGICGAVCNELHLSEIVGFDAVKFAQLKGGTGKH